MTNIIFNKKAWNYIVSRLKNGQRTFYIVEEDGKKIITHDFSRACGKNFFIVVIDDNKKSK